MTKVWPLLINLLALTAGVLGLVGRYGNNSPTAERTLWFVQGALCFLAVSILIYLAVRYWWLWRKEKKDDLSIDC